MKNNLVNELLKIIKKLKPTLAEFDEINDFLHMFMMEHSELFPYYNAPESSRIDLAKKYNLTDVQVQEKMDLYLKEFSK